MLAISPGVEFSSKYPSLKRQINALQYVHVVDKKQLQIVVVQYRKETYNLSHHRKFSSLSKQM